MAKEIMGDIANIDIFEYSVINEEERQAGQIYIELDGHKISGKNYRDNQIKFFLFLLKQAAYRPLVEDFCLNGKPKARHCIGNEANTSPNGLKYSMELEKDLYLYVHLSTDERRKAIQKFVDTVGLKITFHWN